MAIIPQNVVEHVTFRKAERKKAREKIKISDTAFKIKWLKFSGGWGGGSG